MGNRQFSNDASSLLAGTINAASTVVAVSTGDGALFPTLSGSEYFIATLQVTSGNIEYVKVTAVTGDNLTVVRAQEGSTAQSFTANLVRVELRDTAGTMAAFYQKDGDTLSGPMNLGAQTVTNGTLSTGIKINAATEIVNTPIRGATGITTNQITVPTDGSRAQAGGQNILVLGDPIPAFTIGMIMMWNAAALDIPDGWHVCDGTSGTPDLRDKFVLGAGGSHALGASGTLTSNTSAVSAGTPTIAGHALTIGELAAHQHPFDYFFGSGTAVIGDPGFSSPAEYLFGGSGSGSRISYAGKSTGSGTAHTHTASALSTHTHTVSVDPYYALYYIMFVGP